MLSLMQPSEQLLAALFVGAATVSAAVVNATAQVKVAREARRNAKPAPPPSKRARRWLFVGAAVALGLGWNAMATPGAADAGADPRFLGAGVSSVLGSTPDDDARLMVAAIELRQPMTEEQAVALLHDYNLRAYAVDLRLGGEPEAWLPLPPERQPAVSLPRSRAEAVRRAWQQACALESALLTASDPVVHVVNDVAEATAAPAVAVSGDSVAGATARDAASAARTRAELLAEEPAVIHALRVVASAAAAARVAQDEAVARAEIVRHDPGWDLQAVEPAATGCDVVRLDDD